MTDTLQPASQLEAKKSIVTSQVSFEAVSVCNAGSSAALISFRFAIGSKHILIFYHRVPVRVDPVRRIHTGSARCKQAEAEEATCDAEQAVAEAQAKLEAAEIALRQRQNGMVGQRAINNKSVDGETNPLMKLDRSHNQVQLLCKQMMEDYTQRCSDLATGDGAAYEPRGNLVIVARQLASLCSESEKGKYGSFAHLAHDQS